MAFHGTTPLVDRRSVRPHPAEPNYGILGAARAMVHRHRLTADALLAAALFAASTGWLLDSPHLGLRSLVGQAVLIGPLVWRRAQPMPVFLVISGIALVGWTTGPPLIANGAVLVALYTVAVDGRTTQIVLAGAISELGAILAGWRWHPAGTLPRSVVFLTVTVLAALCAGLTVRLASEYLAWLTERAHRLEIERDQQASIAGAAERTRIAREIHDIVAHSLSVLITLVDAAAVVNRSDPVQADRTMHQASEVGRQALGDMRTMIGVLRTGSDTVDFTPQPGLEQLGELLDGVRATGLAVSLAIEGEAAPVGPAAQLTIYRVVQESLTNVMKHASATTVAVTIRFSPRTVTVQVVDDGTAIGADPAGGATMAPDRVGVADLRGHGIAGMRERAVLHRGRVDAGPSSDGGWKVGVALSLDPVEVVS